MGRINLNQWVASQQDKHFCHCGCNQTIKVLRDHHARGIPEFINGHSSRVSNPMQGRFGRRNPNFKRGRYIDKHGYVVVLQGRGRRNYYAYEHRLVMEKHLRRRLRPDEQVHHVNGVKTDNHIENLQVLSASEHTQLHQEQLRKQVGESRYLKAKRRIHRGQPYKELLSCSA